MRLLDTNHCSRIMAGDELALAQLAEHVTDGFCTSFIVQGEHEYMVCKSQRRVENQQRLDDFLSDILVYGIDGRTSELCGQLKSDLFNHYGPRERAARRRFTLTGLGFADNDLWIAATALQHGFMVVSSDSDFARIQEVFPLKLESW